MISKSIVFTKPCVVEVLEEEVKKPSENEVVVKLMVSSISSGTERANLIGEVNISIGKSCSIFPRRCGYSSAGVITEIGSNVADLKVGDKVTTAWGTHNQYITISQKNVFKINDISFEDAALFNIATFPLAAIRKCRLEIGESAIVMGMGVLGLIALKLLKKAGATPIIAVDPNPEKREKALLCGADFALDPYDEDFVKTARELTGGGANVGIEVTGIGAGLEGILNCMKAFGRVALLGCTRNSDFTIDYYRKVHGPGISLIGAHTLARPKTESSPGWWTLKDDMETLRRLISLGRLSLADIVDETHSPSEAKEIYERLANEKTFPIVQFDWSDFV